MGQLTSTIGSVLTDLSAIPLLFGKCELLVMCLNPYNSANSS